MKNKQLVIISIMLISAICLATVGYALLVDDLSVKGNVSINNLASNDDYDNDICFDPEATIKATLVAYDQASKTTKTLTKTATDTDTDGVKASVATADNGDANDLLTMTVDAGLLNFENDCLTVIAKVKNDSTEFSALVSAVQNTVTGDAGLTTDNIQFCATEDGTYTDTITIEKGSSAFVKVTITLKKTVTGDETHTVGDFTFALSATYNNTP